MKRWKVESLGVIGGGLDSSCCRRSLIAVAETGGQLAVDVTSMGPGFDYFLRETSRSRRSISKKVEHCRYSQ